MQNVKEPTNRCWYCILSALDLRVGPWKIQKYYFLSMVLQEHTEWCGITHLDIGAPKMHFSAKITKMSLVNLGLTKSQTRSKSSQNKNFHDFLSNPSFSKIFGYFDQVWLSLTRSWSRVGRKTLILIQPLKRVRFKVITKIIKFSFQRLFMGQNRS